MTYRAWNLKPLDRAALRELTQAIAEQATEELEYNAQNDEPWSEQKYAAALAAQQKENALLAGVLTARGITDPTEALTLLAGEEELSDPSLLTDMDKACERIWRAIDEGETIVVFGDYDVDGVTATALLYQHLKGMGATVKCMLPSREGDGYGLSRNAIRSIHDKGCKLIVTVDNGISAVEEADYAAELGIDLIITDHHLPGDLLPEAACIVNPNVGGCDFPSKALAGCGVMFYVLMALRTELRNRGVFDRTTQPRLDKLSDLVALGTVADVVQLDHNNRVLVAQGLNRVRRGLACPGINALFEVTGRDPANATARDFAFGIAPRINAAGRLTEMGIGIECLLTDDPVTAQELAQELDSLNRERRELEDTMQLDANALVSHMDWEHRATVTLFEPDWHQGVVGLVASRVKEKINRPVIAFAPDDEEGLLKGSGRSIEGIHLRDALDHVSKMRPDIIERFGGHAMAAGLTIKRDNLDVFIELFEKAVSESVCPETFDRVIYTDGALAPEEITFGLVNALSGRIWGQGFERPVFANDFTILSQRVLKETHLKLVLDMAGNRFEGIFFRRNEPLASHVKLAYRPEINEYLGRRSIQLVIEAVEG